MEMKVIMSMRVCLLGLLMIPNIVSGMCFDGTAYFGPQTSFPLIDAVNRVVARYAECNSAVKFLSSTTHGSESNIYYKVEIAVVNDKEKERRMFIVRNRSCEYGWGGIPYTNALPQSTFSQLWESFPKNGIDRTFLSIVEWDPEEGNWFVSNTNMACIVQDVRGHKVIRRLR